MKNWLKPRANQTIKQEHVFIPENKQEIDIYQQTNIFQVRQKAMEYAVTLKTDCSLCLRVVISCVVFVILSVFLFSFFV